MTFECNITNWAKFGCDRIWNEVCPNTAYGTLNCASWTPILIILAFMVLVLSIIISSFVNDTEDQKEMLEYCMNNGIWEVSDD